MARRHNRVESMSTQPTFRESRMQALRFAPLNSDGSNYLEWVTDAKIVLSADDLASTLSNQATTSTDPAQQIPAAARWQALILLRRHLDHALRFQYLHVDDPAQLLAQLHCRFIPQVLDQAWIDWINLRVFNFPDIAAFNSELLRITSQLRLCGQTFTDADLIEKTLSTFPPAHAILALQYRDMKFEKHASLISELLEAEKLNQQILRNAESRPARAIHTFAAAHGDFGGPFGAIVPAGGAGSREPNLFVAVGHDAEEHVDEASQCPPKGSYRKSQPKLHRQMARENQYKPGPFQPRSTQPKPAKGNCHECGRRGHLAKECRGLPT